MSSSAVPQLKSHFQVNYFLGRFRGSLLFLSWGESNSFSKCFSLWCDRAELPWKTEPLGSGIQQMVPAEGVFLAALCLSGEATQTCPGRSSRIPAGHHFRQEQFPDFQQSRVNFWGNQKKKKSGYFWGAENLVVALNRGRGRVQHRGCWNMGLRSVRSQPHLPPALLSSDCSSLSFLPLPQTFGEESIPNSLSGTFYTTDCSSKPPPRLHLRQISPSWPLRSCFLSLPSMEFARRATRAIPSCTSVMPSHPELLEIIWTWPSSGIKSKTHQFHPPAAGKEEALSSSPKCLFLYKYGLNYSISFKGLSWGCSESLSLCKQPHSSREAKAMKALLTFLGGFCFKTNLVEMLTLLWRWLALHPAWGRPAFPQILFFSWAWRNFRLPKAVYVWLSLAPTISFSKEMQARPKMSQAHK